MSPPTETSLSASYGGFAFTGPAAVKVFQCLALATALDLYAKTRIKANRAYTPKRMLATAERLTGRHFRPRDYTGAAKALRNLARNLDVSFSGETP